MGKWKKIKNVIKEHPYIVIEEASMSMRKASQELEEEGYISYLEMVAKAKKESDLPVEVWKIVDRSIARSERQFGATISRIFSQLFRFRRLAIVCLCIILLTGFFTVVPAGRALASQFIEFVIEVVEGWGIIRNSGAHEPDYQLEFQRPSQTEIDLAPDAIERQEYKTISEFENDTGLKSYIMDSKEFGVNYISYYEDLELGPVLTISISTLNCEIQLRQVWGEAQSRLIIPENQAQGELFVDNNTYAYYRDEKDNTLSAFWIYDDSVVRMTLHSNDLDQLRDIIEMLKN